VQYQVAINRFNEWTKILLLKPQAPPAHAKPDAQFALQQWQEAFNAITAVSSLIFVC
jgi:hypothetical protein